MRFFAHELSLDIIRQLRPLVRILRHSDRDLARQIVKAASSASLNIPEGNRREGKDRKYHFRVAAGSTAETRSALLVSIAWGFLEQAQTETVLDKLDHLLAILWKLTR